MSFSSGFKSKALAFLRNKDSKFRSPDVDSSKLCWQETKPSPERSAGKHNASELEAKMQTVHATGQVRVKCPACTTLLTMPQGETKFKCAVCSTIAQIPAQAASSPAPAAVAGYGGAGDSCRFEPAPEDNMEQALNMLEARDIEPEDQVRSWAAPASAPRVREDRMPQTASQPLHLAPPRPNLLLPLELIQTMHGIQTGEELRGKE